MSSGSDHSIFSAQLIDSMRYGGYSNAATALAELIDNSVEAGATKVEVLCKDRIMQADFNTVERIDEIAVVDNGSGMSMDELWDSLRLGVGTRASRRGIGRFGMGLPNASISQCSRVDVYSWQDAGAVLATRLDLDEIKRRSMHEIPMPVKSAVPDPWADASEILPADSGTVVVWSNLDRCAWKRSSTVIGNSERIVGRTYRRFLDNKRLTIRMSPIGPGHDAKKDLYVLPNDPLYLMAPSSTPPPWSDKPMFRLDGEKPEVTFSVKGGDGQGHQVKLRFAFARKEAREEQSGQSAGALPHGRHASRNLGVSIVRADREIGLDQNLLQTYDPLERWWGAEIEFPPALDEFFGVTNNKQSATNFSTMTKIMGARSKKDSEDDMPYDEIEGGVMKEIVAELQKRIRYMRNQIKCRQAGTKPGETTRHPVDAAARRREEGGHTSHTGEDRHSMPDEARSEALRQSLSGQLAGEDLDTKVKDLIESGLRVYFTKAALNGSQLFDLSLEGGVEVIRINTNHNAYENFIALLDDFDDSIGCKEAIRRLKKAQIGLLLLVGSWARYEDEEPNTQRRKDLANVRYRWGVLLDDYLKRDGDGAS